MLCILQGSSPRHQQQTAGPWMSGSKVLPSRWAEDNNHISMFPVFFFYRTISRQCANSSISVSRGNAASPPPKLSQAPLKKQAPVQTHTKWGRNESWFTVGCCQILARIYFIENMGSRKNVSARMLHWWSNQCGCFIHFRWTSKNSIWLHLVCWTF